MNSHRLASALTAAVLTGTTAVAIATPAQAAQTSQGTRSLGTYLAADGHHFDRNWKDFDIYEVFVKRVLDVKPGSQVRVLYDGGRRVTAFMPTDAGYRRTASIILERRFHTERAVARAMWRAAGGTRAERADLVEKYLLYGLVANRTLTAKKLTALAPTRLHTMQGGTLRIGYRDGRLYAIDRDKDSPNARVVVPDVNKGNRQIGHGLNVMLSFARNP